MTRARIQCKGRLGRRCRPILIIAFALSLLPAAARADIACTPSTALPKQYRTSIKHRAPAASTIRAITTTVAEVIGWDSPAGSADPKVRKKDSPLAPKEQQVYALEGDVWLVKTEGNDCDFHMELSGPGGRVTDDRIIVEIPQGASFVTSRENLLDALVQAGLKKPKGKFSRKLEPPIRVRLTGYAFYDGKHYSPKNPKRGTGHGSSAVATLWEIHPVWKVEVLNQH